MAINKDKNTNLQITLSKNDASLLIDIQSDLSALFNIELSKSQTIAFLIKNYNQKATLSNQVVNKEQAPKKSAPKPNENNINYQSQILALKDKLNVSYPKLSQIIGIPTSTLKKYANGSQQPTGANKETLLNMLARYGIK